MGAADRVDHGRPVLGARRLADPGSPGAGEHVVHHQHRHVAPHPVALGGNGCHRLHRGRPQAGVEGVELHDIRPRREIRVPPVGQDPAAHLDERGGIRGEVLVAAGHEKLRDCRSPRDGRGRHGWARNPGSTAYRERPAPPGRRPGRPGHRGDRRRRSPRMQYGDPTTSVGRQSGRAAWNAASRSVLASAIVMPTGLRCQTPINQTASNPRPASSSQYRSGTEPRSMPRPSAALIESSHAQVLIS